MRKAYNPFFVETCLSAIHEQFFAACQAPFIQILTGMPGAGKTFLAQQYAQRYQSEYADIYLLTRDRFSQDLYWTVNGLFTIPLQQHGRLGSDWVRDTLRHNQERWLLILDDVEDTEWASALIPRSAGRVLVTMRSMITGTFGDTSYFLESMTPDTGAVFLLRRVGLLEPNQEGQAARKEDWAAARRICEKLGGLPLALDYAGGYLQATHCGLSEYLDRLSHNPSLLWHHREEHRPTLAELFNHCFEQVEQENPDALVVLQYCAVLHPQPLSEEVLFAACPGFFEELRSDAAARTLFFSSLADRNRDDGTLFIHPLVVQLLRERMGETLWGQRVSRVARLLSKRGKH
jgi:hypothetical protein